MKKIFVKSNFKQQDGDKVLYEHDDMVAIEVADESLYAEYIVDVDDETVVKIETEIVDRLTKELNALCDSKSRGAKVIIAGMDVSVEQMEEYQLVAQAVEDNDVTWFEDEAALFGTTAQEEFDNAKNAKHGYEYAYNAFKKLIRLYRLYNFKKLKDRDFITVKANLEEGKMIGVGLEGTPIDILKESKNQVMEIITEKG